MAATILGAAAAAFWLYLIAFRGGFWRLAWRPSAASVPARAVAVVIPARDEAAVIGPAVSSLVAQRHDGPLRVIVVDDHSSDGTAAAARQTAQRCGAAERLIVLRSAPMPGGWTGKLWAMQQGIDLARQFKPDYLLLTDADIVHAPGNLRELVARAEGGRYDLVSLMVRLNCRSRWERLLIPAFVFFFFKLYPPRWVADRRRRTAAAAGGCMLVRRDMLERIGGVEAIRRELIDDCALARRIKVAGGAVWLAAATGEAGYATRSIREYASWRPIWQMISRCAFAQLGYSPLALVATIALMAVIYLAPPVLAVASDGWPRILGVAAWFAMSVAFLPILKSYRCPWRLAPLLPAMAAFYTAATIASAVQFWRGRGGHWKGRFQAAPIR